MQALEEASGGADDGSAEQQEPKDTKGIKLKLEGTAESFKRLKRMLFLAASKPGERTQKEQDEFSNFFDSEEKAQAIAVYKFKLS